MRKTLFASLAALVLIGSAAQAQPPGGGAPPQRVQGTVSAVSDSSLTLAKADGSSETLALLPGRTVMIVSPVAVDQIVPGSYVATANKSQADGSGVSTEIRVYPPDWPRIDVNRAMDQTGELMMTNGKVAKAVSSDGGRLLTVDFGTGTRQIKVPADIQVMSNTTGSPAQVKVGVKLAIITFPAGGGGPGRQSITINKADLPGM